MVSISKSTLQQLMLNFILTGLILLLCLNIMVSCRQQDEEFFLHNVPPKDTNEIVEVVYLKKIVLDENTLLDFPIQEDGHIKWINIAESISHSHCAKFGVLLLGLNKVSDVNAIVEQNQDLACEMILSKWLTMEGTKNEPTTFRTLINAIRKIGGNGYSELANKIQVTAEAHQTMDTDYIPVLVREYSLQLFERYQKDYVIDRSQWIPKRLDRNITFVDLELKEENKDDLQLDDLLRSIQDGMRILFTGRPGVGKTTILRHLSKHMYKFRHFFPLVKFHFGTLNGPIDNLDALLKTHHTVPGDMAYISNFIEKTNGKGVCFLLDGYDEYVPLRHGNYINSLIEGTKLTNAVVMVTSRPSAVENITYLFERRIEIIGFAEAKINTYLRQFQLSDAQNKTINQYLDNHPNVRQMCYLPLHLSMLVYMIIATDDDPLTLVNTETELYFDFLALTVKNYENVRHNVAVETLKKCFSDSDVQSNLCVILRTISKIAYNGVNNSTQVFTSPSLTGLSEVANMSTSIEALSLFKIETSYNRHGIKFYKYYYLHPTFQEFLAAIHLTTLYNHLNYTYLHHVDMHEVNKYYWGLLRIMSKYDDDAIMSMFMRFAKEYTFDRDIANHDFYMIKCAHEAGDDSQFVTYLQVAGIINDNNSLYIRIEDYQSHDCWYLGYILAQTSLHELNLKIIDFSVVTLCLQFGTKYLKSDVKFSGNANVKELVIEPDDLEVDSPDNGLEIMDLEFLSLFQSSTKLKLFVAIQETNSFLQLAEVLKSFRMLQSLSLFMDISIIKESHLEEALQESTHLWHLCLLLINNNHMDIPNNLLEFRKLKQLKNLQVYFAIFDETPLLGILKYPSNIETLSMQFWFLINDFKLLGIQEAHSIKELTLHTHYNDICGHNGYGNKYHFDHDQGILSTHYKEVAKLLDSAKFLLTNFSLYIQCHSPMEELVMINIVDMLENLTKLQELSLYVDSDGETCYNHTIDEGAMVLAIGDKLKHLYNLHTINLHLNFQECCFELMVLFSSLLNLQNIDFKCISWGKTDMNKFLNNLINLKQLKKLVLSDNHIGDDDMESLVKALKEMSNLHTLDLSHNDIGDNGMKLLAELFDSPQQYLLNLTVLKLHYNRYSEVGAKSLADKLKTLKSLQLHTIEFNKELVAFSSEILFLRYQQKIGKKTHIILPKKPLIYYIAENLYLMFQQYHYHIFSVVLGLVVLGAMFYKSNANKSTSTELYKALSTSPFSVWTAWNLQRLANLNFNLDGTGTVIAILDTIVNKDLLKFETRKISVVDCLPDTKITTYNEHGTICAAVAVGHGPLSDDNIHRGIAPGTQLIIYRIAEGKASSSEAILRALDDIQYKVEKELQQIDVVSISYDCVESIAQEIYNKIEMLTRKGVTFVAAAGNRGEYQARACIPACFDNVISVGALDRNGKESSFTPPVKIDVYAPGEDILIPSTQVTVEGTSYATPAVAGLVLLLKQWANHIGPPAKENIHCVEILNKIFKNDMMVKSESGDKDIFEPVEFFMRMKDNPTMLNDIVQKYLDEENKIIHLSELSRGLSCNSFSVSDAWDLNRLNSINLNGTGTVIAILDTTVDQSFAGFTGKNILNTTINESITSYTGENLDIIIIDCLPHVSGDYTGCRHGTICSAVAVGVECGTTDGVIPRGVAPGAGLIVYRIAEGENVYIEAILNALNDTQNKVESGMLKIDVVSISYHCNEKFEKEISSKIKILTEMGITFVAAAGNRGEYQAHACIPARFDNVISVGAVGKYGNKISLAHSSVKVDVYAPGEDIEFPTIQYKFWGTSYAAPAVAGLVSLLKQWANHVGSPAKENIHCVEILREMFDKDLCVKSDGNGAPVFAPVDALLSMVIKDSYMKNNPEALLNKIVRNYLSKK